TRSPVRSRRRAAACASRPQPSLPAGAARPRRRSARRVPRGTPCSRSGISCEPPFQAVEASVPSTFVPFDRLGGDETAVAERHERRVTVLLEVDLDERRRPCRCVLVARLPAPGEREPRGPPHLDVLAADDCRDAVAV